MTEEKKTEIKLHYIGNKGMVDFIKKIDEPKEKIFLVRDKSGLLEDFLKVSTKDHVKSFKELSKEEIEYIKAWLGEGKRQIAKDILKKLEKIASE